MTTDQENWKADRIEWLNTEIIRLRRELASAPVYSSMSVDGVNMTLDRKSIRDEIKEYTTELKQLEGLRPVISTVEFDKGL